MLKQSSGISIPKAMNQDTEVAFNLAAVPGCFNALITIEMMTANKYGYTNLLLGREDLEQFRSQTIAYVNNAIPMIEIDTLRINHNSGADQLQIIPTTLVINEEGVLSFKTKVDGISSPNSIKLHDEAFNYIINTARSIDDSFGAYDEGPTEEYDEEDA